MEEGGWVEEGEGGGGGGGWMNAGRGGLDGWKKLDG